MSQSSYAGEQAEDLHCVQWASADERPGMPIWDDADARPAVLCGGDRF
jgi:hypothetical protein